MPAAFVFRIARHEMTAMIADEHHNGVPIKPFLLESLANFTYGFVDALEAAVVIGQLLLPRSGKVAHVCRNERILIALGITFRRDHVAEIVLLVRFQVGDDQQERRRLAGVVQETLGAAGQEIDSILVLIVHGPAVAIVDIALVWMRGVFELIGSFPEVKKAAAASGRNRSLCAFR